MEHRPVEENLLWKDNGHRLMVFGDTVESRALAIVLSVVSGPTCFRDFSETVQYVSKLSKTGRTSSGNNETIILHDSRRFLRPTRLIDTLYELRFSVGWLGPVLILACPESLKKIESTDLFRISGDGHDPVPQRCVSSSPLSLGVLLTALSKLDGYGKFALKKVEQCVRDKDLIPQARKLGQQLTVCIDGVRDIRRLLKQIRKLLRERDGALLRFLPGHGHLAALNRLLVRENLCFRTSDIPAELQQVVDALMALPKIREDWNG